MNEAFQRLEREVKRELGELGEQLEAARRNGWDVARTTSAFGSYKRQVQLAAARFSKALKAEIDAALYG